MFNEVTRDKISLHIVQQIREAVMSGKLKSGDRLPTEKDLIGMFGVSKHTLREALRALETMGFLEIRKGAGGGPVVSEVDMATTRNSIANFLHFKDVSIRDLSELRGVLEPYAAREAAHRLTSEQIDRLKDLNRNLRLAMEEGRSITGGQFEIAFHTILAEAVGNPVMSLILDFVNSLLTDIKLRLKPGHDFSRQVLDAHEAILDALIQGDEERAALSMHHHVLQVEEGLEALRESDQGFGPTDRAG